MVTSKEGLQNSDNPTKKDKSLGTSIKIKDL